MYLGRLWSFLAATRSDNYHSRDKYRELCSEAAPTLKGVRFYKSKLDDFQSAPKRPEQHKLELLTVSRTDI